MSGRNDRQDVSDPVLAAVDRVFARQIELVYADRDRSSRDGSGIPVVDPATSRVLHLLDGLHQQVRAIVRHQA